MTAEMLKKYLRNVGWLYSLNAAVKARATKRRYRKTLRYYASRGEHGTFEELLSLRLGDRGVRLRRLQRPPNILFLGTDEMQDRSGIIQALEKMGHLACFTQPDGSYGQNSPLPVGERAEANGRRLLETVQRLHAEGASPDIIIAQTWANLLDAQVLSEIKNAFNTVVVNISMDDRHQYWGRKINGVWGGTYGLTAHIDLALTAAPECVAWYMKEGCPALFFPEASDPRIFRPMPELPKIHDVCFIGGRYGIRETIVRAVEAAGIKVTAYGSGWPNGRIATEHAPRLFAQSRIVLGIGTTGHCRDFYSLKMRDFDGPMSGSLYLTHHNPDLEELFVIGKEIETYKSPEECVEKVRYYINHPAEAEAIGKAGRARAERDHTWEKRFEGLFEVLGLRGRRDDVRDMRDCKNKG